MKIKQDLILKKFFLIIYIYYNILIQYLMAFININYLIKILNFFLSLLLPSSIK